MNVNGRLGDKGNQDEPDNPESVVAVSNSDAADEQADSKEPSDIRQTTESIIRAFSGSEQPLRSSRA
jgi:hypothetical protein